MLLLEEVKDFSRPGRSLTGRSFHPENGELTPKNTPMTDRAEICLELFTESTGIQILISGISLFSL